MHFDVGQVPQDIGRVFEAQPVELQVLARRPVAEAAVVALGDERELAHLRRAQEAVWDGDAHHVGVALQVEAVHQAQRPELVLGQLAGHAALDLASVLFDALTHDAEVDVVITIHARRALDW